MWGITSGSFMASVRFDTDAPLGAFDVFLNEARYDSSLPLVAPLGIEIDFGPYEFDARPDTALDRYSTRVRDSMAFGDMVILEAIATPGAITLAPPTGFDTLELVKISVEFLPPFDPHEPMEDLFSGTAIPDEFWTFAWPNTRILVDVFDPAENRDGRAILNIVTVARAGGGACQDGLDNDGDGLVDLSDPGCEDANDLSEHSPLLVCDDGVDNETGFPDDLADFPADPGCRNATWWTEEPRCQDGVNNDGRAGVDFDGGASVHGAPVDVADPDCVGKPWKNRERRSTGGCGLGVERGLVALPLLWLRRRRRGVAP
jgi:hypothetical protein